MKGKEEMVGSCLLSSVMRAKIGREHPLSVERFVFKKKQIGKVLVVILLGKKIPKILERVVATNNFYLLNIA